MGDFTSTVFAVCLCIIGWKPASKFPGRKQVFCPSIMWLNQLGVPCLLGREGFGCQHVCIHHTCRTMTLSKLQLQTVTQKQMIPSMLHSDVRSSWYHCDGDSNICCCDSTLCEVMRASHLVYRFSGSPWAAVELRMWLSLHGFQPSGRGQCPSIYAYAYICWIGNS